MKDSNSNINKVGWVLAELDNSFSTEDAFKKLKKFRLGHSHTMRSFRVLLHRKIRKLGIDNETSISQRLKRTHSIVKKIKINKTMKLSKMQDIAGIRVVVDNLKDIEKINSELKMSERSPNFKSTRKKEDNYITGNSPGPKESGYRSLHIIYEYGKDDHIGKYFVEIQVRSKLHHAWATAVEIMGAFLNQPLKQSFGDENVLELFKKISKVFYLYENGEKDLKLALDVERELKKENLIDKLKVFKISTENITRESKKGSGKYFLIQLNFDNKTLSINRFSGGELEDANKKYIELENKFKDKNIDIVLVSVEDIQKLEEMYPNYFLDADKFIEYLEKSLIEIKK